MLVARVQGFAQFGYGLLLVTRGGVGRMEIKEGHMGYIGCDDEKTLTVTGCYGIIGASMYIPTQKERYSAVGNFTLLLYIVIPSAVVMGLYSGLSFMMMLSGFALPLAWPLAHAMGNLGGAMIISSVLQLVAYLLLRRSKMPAKKKLTIAILWGMSFALIVRIILAFESAILRGVEQGS